MTKYLEQYKAPDNHSEMVIDPVKAGNRKNQGVDYPDTE